MVLNTNFGVDHVDFTNASPAGGGNGGRHNTVTLVQQVSDPTAVTTSPILYCKSTTSNTVNNDIYFERASNDGSTVVQLTTSLINPIAATAGITFLPGGIIMQWNLVSLTSGGAVTFAGIGMQAFPTNCFVVLLTNATSSTSRACTLAGAPSRTGFSFIGPLGAQLTNVFAIGN